MPEYYVTWDIDVEADAHREAAQEAWKLRNHEGSIANVFTVREKLLSGKLGRPVVIDLSVKKPSSNSKRLSK
jgi:hypothetical protein